MGTSTPARPEHSRRAQIYPTRHSAPDVPRGTRAAVAPAPRPALALRATTARQTPSGRTITRVRQAHSRQARICPMSHSVRNVPLARGVPSRPPPPNPAQRAPTPHGMVRKCVSLCFRSTFLCLLAYIGYSTLSLLSSACFSSQAAGPGSAWPSCIICPSGYSCGAGSLEPIPCGVGFTSAAGASACVSCPAGYYCELNATDTASLASCPRGLYCPSGMATAPDPVVNACPTGHFCTVAVPSPVPCAPGSYNPSTGVCVCVCDCRCSI